MYLPAGAWIEAAQAPARKAETNLDELTLCVWHFGEGADGFDELAVVASAAVRMIGDLLDDVVCPGAGGFAVRVALAAARAVLCALRRWGGPTGK